MSLFFCDITITLSFVKLFYYDMVRLRVKYVCKFALILLYLAFNFVIEGIALACQCYLSITFTEDRRNFKSFRAMLKRYSSRYQAFI